MSGTGSRASMSSGLCAVKAGCIFAEGWASCISISRDQNSRAVGLLGEIISEITPWGVASSPGKALERLVVQLQRCSAKVEAQPGSTPGGASEGCSGVRGVGGTELG